MKNKEGNKDKGLRQALQRRNETAERMMLPEDFTDKLMERLEQATPSLPPRGEEPTPNPSQREGRIKSLPSRGRLEGASYRGGWWGLVAACLLIIIGVGMTLLPKEELAKTQSLVVKKTEQPHPREDSKKASPIGGGWRELPIAKSKAISQRPARTTPTPQTPPHVQNVAVSPQPTAQATDSLDYYIDKIERELAQVDESLYIERMNKVIRADERLQRMVNSYILHTLDKDGRPQTAENMYNEKPEQDEE